MEPRRGKTRRARRTPKRAVPIATLIGAVMVSELNKVPPKKSAHLLRGRSKTLGLPAGASPSSIVAVITISRRIGMISIHPRIGMIDVARTSYASRSIRPGGAIDHGIGLVDGEGK